MKNSKSLLLLSVALVSCPLLTMCHHDADAPVAAGTLRATDPFADTLMAEANGWYQAGEFKKARRLYSQINNKHHTAPCAPMSRFMTALCYEALQEYRDAFKQYQRVVDDYPQSELYHKALNAQLKMAHQAVDGKLKGKVLWGAWEVDMDSSVVIQWLNQIITNAPYNEMAASSTAVLGKYLVEHERFDQARVTYSQLVEKYPLSKYAPGAQLMVAHLWADNRTRGDQNIANLAKAEEAYEEFSLRFPNSKEAGKALKQASDMRRLMIDQELAVAEYYIERAEQYDAALFCLKEVIRQKKVNPQAAAKAEALVPKVQSLMKAQEASGPKKWYQL